MYKTGGSICKAKSVPYIYGVRVCRKRKALARGRGFSESWQQQGLQQDIAKAGLENLQGFGRKLVNLVIKNNQGEVGVFYKFRFDIFVKTVFRDKSL